MPRVVIIVFDGVQTLDVAGPAEVFANATRVLPRADYEIVLASTAGGAITTTAGMALTTCRLASLRPRPTDRVLVAGGTDEAVTAAVLDDRLARWLARTAARVHTIGSICSGAFVLANAGLLDGLRAATHWDSCDRLASFRPAVTVDRDAIFVREGRVWTSAGVTTGIDMALAMVEDDNGPALANTVAARLVLYARRPGFQSQFSDALVAQTTASDPLGPTIAWARLHLRGATVETLARHAGMALRTFHRRCLALLGTTPAKLLEKLRVEHARMLLSTSAGGAKEIAESSGFGSAARMNRAFTRELGVTPRDYRLLFSRPAHAAVGVR